ncbi:MAG: DegT/DnrJ/EryC1/StrS family aminotransferase [Lentisphaerae bacterium]|nr:DegT/DnrJ/EryC1/StrS family aminotransferase [Lentisphaerota bacterium]
MASTMSTPVLLGGLPSVTLPRPGWPVVDAADVEAVAAVVRSGVWSWVGPQERAFCEEYARFLGCRYCLCLANGTVTLQCALQAVGVEPGDEVIVPGLTWVATAQAALDIGAEVVFADVNPRTMGLDPASLEAAITPRTRAVVPVHLYGCMADMDAILEIARRHGLRVVEDVAHQHGSRWRGQAAGTLGDAGSFSFQQSKVLTSGEGGAVACNDPEVYRTVFALKQVGWAPAEPERAPFEGLVAARRYGHNYRITEMQAALLRGGLRRLAEQTARREASAQALAAGLAALGGPLQAVPRDERVTTQAYYAMTLHFDPDLAGGLTREQYLRAVQAEGLSLGVPYTAVYRHPLLNLDDRTSPLPYRQRAGRQDYASLALPGVEAATTRTGVILMHQALLGSQAYLEQILQAVRKVNDHLEPLRKALAEKA